MYEAASGLSTDTRFSIITTLLVFVASTVIGLMTYIVKGATRMTRTEAKLSELVDDIKEMIVAKEKDHDRLGQALKHIYESTDKRLRFLEENFWKRR
jgi:hypothetical protein